MEDNGKMDGVIGSIRPIARPDTLTNLAYDRIKTFLVSGKLEQHRIYPASQFADMLGVSRTPVREALLQLASEGYLDFVKGRGFSVSIFTEEEVREFFQLRKIVEPFVVGDIVDSISEKNLQRLLSLLNNMENVVHEDPDRLIKYDGDFHLMLLREFGNRFLMSVMENVRGLLSTLGLRAVGVSGRGRSVVDEHRRIVEAMADKDRDGTVSAMFDHLNSTEEHLLRCIKQM